MNYILNIGQGVYVTFETAKEMLDFLKKWFISIFLYGPLAIIFSFFIGLGIAGFAALAFYYFLTHIDFFLFDIPIKILENL